MLGRHQRVSVGGCALMAASTGSSAEKPPSRPAMTPERFSEAEPGPGFGLSRRAPGDPQATLLWIELCHRRPPVPTMPSLSIVVAMPARRGRTRRPGVSTGFRCCGARGRLKNNFRSDCSLFPPYPIGRRHEEELGFESSLSPASTGGDKQRGRSVAQLT